MQDQELDSPLALMQYDMGHRYIHGRHLDLINENLIKLLDDNDPLDKFCVVLPLPGMARVSLISIYIPAYIMATREHVTDNANLSYGKGLVEDFTLASRDIAEHYGNFPFRSFSFNGRILIS